MCRCEVHLTGQPVKRGTVMYVGMYATYTTAPRGRDTVGNSQLLQEKPTVMMGKLQRCGQPPFENNLRLLFDERRRTV